MLLFRVSVVVDGYDDHPYTWGRTACPPCRLDTHLYMPLSRYPPVWATGKSEVVPYKSFLFFSLYLSPRE